MRRVAVRRDRPVIRHRHRAAIARQTTRAARRGRITAAARAAVSASAVSINAVQIIPRGRNARRIIRQRHRTAIAAIATRSSAPKGQIRTAAGASIASNTPHLQADLRRREN